ncbi:hypothetical protein CTI12_AA091790 [Artemisia annua]|uniref:Uncharacterized protein n=1 Tax=Artemisia annua TaxID=35608 RepID=A0A2U1Q042_ARTAN|nr:hypothetical protein CTI12_AA091790 [Artemisia annua]
MPRPIKWAGNDPLLSHGRDHKTRLITLWLHGHDASTRHGFLSLEESRIQRRILLRIFKPYVARATPTARLGKRLEYDETPDAGPVVKKRLSKKMRHIPDYYFPRRSMLANIAIYGPCIVGGIGAGMLTEIWINKKVQKGIDKPSAYGFVPI